MKMPLSRLAFLAIGAALVAALTWGAWAIGYRTALGPLAARGASDLALASDRLVGELRRYRELAVLTADRPEVARQLAVGGGDADFETLLLGVRDKSGALLVAVADTGGRIVARGQPGWTPDLANSQAFARAMQGALGFETVMSEAPRRRAMLFAAPVFSEAGPVIGAVLVVANLEAVEAAWRGNRPAVMFRDAGGVVFLSNRSELVLTGEAGAADAYGEPVGPFVDYRARRIGGHEIWDLPPSPYLPERALHLTLDLPVIGMTGEALIDVAPARTLARLQAAAVAALSLFFGAVILVVTERRRALAEANRLLEDRVARRTEALTREVAERRAAEARLTRAQADLVRAGKLSALGQMSAGISHELNQPLTAIASYAENARGFLDRGKTDVAAANLARIAELTERMGRIIRALRAFARQEAVPSGPVDLRAVLAEAETLAAPAARASGTEIVTDLPEGALWVEAGEVRLSQVFLNLYANAIDAMAEARTRRITVSAEVSGDRVAVRVHDTGPGLADPDRVFEPFYSTKAVDHAGMGLGLSISYGLVQSFGGDIRGRTHPEGGAEFTVVLLRAEAAPAREAAE